MKGIMLAVFILAVATARAQSPVPPDAKVEQIATGFQFVEGPVWMNNTLLFSDFNQNKIFRWWPAGDSVSTYMYPSDSSNGLTLDMEGRLVFCQMGYRRVVRLDSDMNVTPLASGYNGKKFNSPNDLVVKSDGAIFFTDPDFNVPGGVKNKELTFCGIFGISPSGDVQLLDSSLAEPNGICFSPDQSKLYVNDSQVRKIYVWDIMNDSVLANKRLFVSIQPIGYADGMKVDSAGNIFCTGPLGIWVFSPAGALLDTILVPHTPSNCNWGDADRKTLYITATPSVYRIRLAKGAAGIGEYNYRPHESFKLYSNYPNPFNPTTAISYQFSAASHVVLTVYDELGRELTTLVDTRQDPGVYGVTFDGSGYSSGTFFCRMSASTSDGHRYESTSKMIMLK